MDNTSGFYCQGSRGVGQWRQKGENVNRTRKNKFEDFRSRVLGSEFNISVLRLKKSWQQRKGNQGKGKAGKVGKVHGEARHVNLILPLLY